jgi:hypothetical protein
MSFVAKTIAEQKLEYFESIGRPLTDDESDELRRAMHATYVRTQRQRMLGKHRKEELALLKKLEREALKGSPMA